MRITLNAIRLAVPHFYISSNLLKYLSKLHFVRHSKLNVSDCFYCGYTETIKNEIERSAVAEVLDLISEANF